MARHGQGMARIGSPRAMSWATRRAARMVSVRAESSEPDRNQPSVTCCWTLPAQGAPDCRHKPSPSPAAVRGWQGGRLLCVAWIGGLNVYRPPAVPPLSAFRLLALVPLSGVSP